MTNTTLYKTIDEIIFQNKLLTMLINEVLCLYELKKYFQLKQILVWFMTIIGIYIQK